jgi:acyl-CoA thioesterase
MDISGIRDYFNGDRYLVMTGVTIEEAGDGRAVCAVDIAPEKHFNKIDIVQGGVTYTLADSAFAVAANYRFLDRGETDRFITVSQSANITYLAPPKGKSLICEAEAITRGRVSSVYKMEVKDELGTEVALITVNGYTLER